MEYSENNFILDLHALTGEIRIIYSSNGPCNPAAFKLRW